MTRNHREWIAVQEHYIENTLISPRMLIHMRSQSTKPSEYDGYRQGSVVLHLGDHTHEYGYPRYRLHDDAGWNKGIMDVFTYADALVCPECLVFSGAHPRMASYGAL